MQAGVFGLTAPDTALLATVVSLIVAMVVSPVTARIAARKAIRDTGPRLREEQAVTRRLNWMFEAHARLSTAAHTLGVAASTAYLARKEPEAIPLMVDRVREALQELNTLAALGREARLYATVEVQDALIDLIGSAGRVGMDQGRVKPQDGRDLYVEATFGEMTRLQRLVEDTAGGIASAARALIGWGPESRRYTELVKLTPTEADRLAPGTTPRPS
jgi:hypothetical protein